MIKTKNAEYLVEIFCIYIPSNSSIMFFIISVICWLISVISVKYFHVFVLFLLP